MAIAILNPMFTGLNGRVGGIVFYSYDKKTCMRSYVKPRNPDTPAQRKNRGLFRDAMKAWRMLSPYDKAVFARRARKHGMTGHNLFISRFMISHGKNEDDKASEDRAGPDIRAVRPPSPSLHRAGHSVRGSIPKHIAPYTAPAQALHPGGP